MVEAMTQEKQSYSIGELYKLKEIYRVQGENVCWIARDLIATINAEGLLDYRVSLLTKVRKLEEAINLFEGV